jgi:hypothetical protein
VLPLKAQPHPDDDLLRESLKTVASSPPPGAEDAAVVRNRIAERWGADADRQPDQS